MNNQQLSPKLKDVIDTLDSWRANMVERPQMYASSPEAIEDMLLLLDRIKFLIAGVEAGTPPYASGYSAFLQSKGFEAATFCARRRSRSLTDEDLTLFAELSRFVKEFLKSSMSRIDLNAE